MLRFITARCASIKYHNVIRHTANLAVVFSMKVQLSELPGRTQGRQVQGPDGRAVLLSRSASSLYPHGTDGCRERGRAAETEDAPDLKSGDPMVLCGFDSHRGQFCPH